MYFKLNFSVSQNSKVPKYLAGFMIFGTGKKYFFCSGFKLFHYLGYRSILNLLTEQKKSCWKKIIMGRLPTLLC